jgi:hypothetical protein
LKEDNGDPYVFVFQWTEEVDKFVVYDSNQQMLERYVLKPGWVPVKSSKIIEESLEKNIKCANEDGQVNIQYPHSLDVDRVLDGTLSHFKEFAKQLLEEIKD